MPAPRAVLRRALRLITRRYPFDRGWSRISQTPLHRCLTRRDELVWTRLRDGSLIRINVNDTICRTIYFCADFDPRISRLCRAVLAEGDCCVDVGAHVGAVALQAARRVGPFGAVHAFEPQPALADLLRQSAAANRYSQLHVHGVALSDRDGEASLYTRPAGDTGLATFDRAFAAGSVPVPVPMRRSGDALAALSLQHVRLLKIDIEHHEPQFFAGAVEHLARNPPDIVLFESHSRGVPFWERPPVVALLAMGYRVFQVPRAMTTTPPIPLRPPVDPPHRGWDFLAVHERGLTAKLAAKLGLAAPGRRRRAGRTTAA